MAPILMKPLGIAIALSTLLMAPIWMEHLLSPDGGLVAIGGGKLTLEDVVGDGKKNKGMHPIVFHLTAIAGIAHFTLSFMAMAVAFLGEGAVKKAVTGIYLVWISMIAIVQYTHPWTGNPPESFMDMPMPLVLVILGLCALGLFLEQKSKRD
jgi:hypothetical protein